MVKNLAGPTTELSKEFLEINDYLVRKETKFQNKIKNNKLCGTCSDIDIIAVSAKGISRKEIELSNHIIGEVKNFKITRKDSVDDIYEGKFKFMDTHPRWAWKQLENLIPTKKYDKVIFCRATSQKVYDYALKKYNIKIVTVGLMIKLMADFFKTSDRNWTFYPERYNYNVIKNILNYLYASHKWKDKLVLEDLVWIDPENEGRYRNNFLEMNAKFFEDFVYYQNSWGIFDNILKRVMKNHQSHLKNTLKQDKNFWDYLTK